MKCNMDDLSYFTPGMIISCTTCFEQKIEGEVIGYDYEENLISIKSASSSGKSHLNDLRIINMKSVKDVRCISEQKNQNIPELPNIDNLKILKRKKDNIQMRDRQLAYIGSGVTNEAQSILNYITKTITDVKWKDQDIIVMDKVVISSPYQPENCRPIGTGSTQQYDIAVKQIKKVIEKYHRDNHDL